MTYRPPQKRVATKKEEFPLLAPVSKTTVDPKTNVDPKANVDTKANVSNVDTGKPKMNYAALFKNVHKKKNRVKKLKWGTVLLTKKGMVDSLTPEERQAEEEYKQQELHDQRLWNLCSRLEKQQNLRREFDPRYESPEEWSESESEEEVEEEEEVLTDDYEEDEFEPDI